MQGPAVWALRAQTDKLEYSREMRRLLERTPNLDIREGMAIDLEFGSNDEVTGTAASPVPCLPAQVQAGLPSSVRLIL